KGGLSDMTQKTRLKNLEDFGYGPNVMRNTKVCGICAEADEQMPSAVVGRIIKDGTNFILKATVNEGKEIYATGSQRFPRHYGDFMFCSALASPFNATVGAPN
ncbi:MAG: hypothetical protein IJB19_02820, partial [Clostridia bacterium]|nr:hypothetical protein [Clostridia bacterium]